MTTAQKLSEYLKTHGISQAAASRSIGCSTAKLSLFIGGKYSGDVDAMEKSVT